MDTLIFPERLPSAALESMTPSLKNTWTEIFRWADKNSSLNSLLHIGNATQIWHHPDFLVVIFGFLTDNFLTLCEWAGTNEPFLLSGPITPVQHLFQLSSAAALDASVLNHLGRIQTEMTAAAFLKGVSPKKYLFGMLYQKPNDMGFDDLGWINKLKLWLFVHAIDRAISGNVDDNYLEAASDSLRLACHKNREKRILFLNLQRRVSGFPELSRHIVYSATSFAKKNPSTKFSWLLRDIIQVAKSRHSKKKDADDSTIINLPGPLSAPDSNKPIEPAFDVASEGDDLGAVRVIAGKPGEGNVAEAETDEKASYFHQELKANAILFYSLEDSNFLPWAWNKPNSHELPMLTQWCEENFKASNCCDRALAALVWISIKISRSFRRTLDIKITALPTGEWVVDSKFTTLTRFPPMRKGGWQPDVPDKNLNQKKWAYPAADSINIRLPKAISKILREEANKMTGPKHLGDIWNIAWGKNQETVLREKFSRDLPRILPGMLGNVMAQTCFEASKDQVFARLASSHPNSALPASCAYARWNAEQANMIMNHDAVSLPLEVRGEEDSIALGSRLAAIEPLIVESIRNATLRLESLRHGQNIVDFHNAYTCYLVVGLFAATGGRPVTDPFESVRHFDFHEWFVYLNDKSGGVARDGRLVPLPEKLCMLVGQAYQAHLGVLSKVVMKAKPELSQDLELMSKGCPRGRMPFFFLLDSDYRWKNVSEERIASLKLFDWPLPLNLFRHRLSTWLRHHEADPECIDSILGHAEKGHATHWDYSFRTWKDDMDVMRPLLAQAFDALGFETPSGLPDNLPVLPEGSASHNSANATPALFGIQSREKSRRDRMLESIRDAKLLVREFLEEKNKKLTELSKDEFYDLSKILVFNESGLPHPAGQHKYKFLMRLAGLGWRREGKRVPINRRFNFLGDESSLFTDKAPNAQQVFAEIKAAWEDVLKHSGMHRISLLPASVVAAAALCIDSRITFQAMLKDIRAVKNFRLVALKGNVYIEYAKSLDAKNPDAIARRHRISSDAAILLSKLLAASAFEVANHPVPEELRPISAILENHSLIKNNARCTEFIAALCAIIDQVNAITLPGVLAAYLAGRVETYSLGWRDWMRLELDHAPDIPRYKPSTKDEDEDDPEIGSIPAIGQINIQHLSGLDIEISQQAGRELLKKIDHLLGVFEKGDETYFEASAKILGEPAPQVVSFRKPSRKDLARDINSLIAMYGDKTSSAIQVLGKWVTALLYRKAKGRGGKLIAISTVERYLDALAGAFVKTGYGVDLLIADDDELTLFYSELLESLEVQDTGFVAGRLAQFHKWAKNNFAIEDPDWAELPETFSSLRVSTGIITEKEYKSALRKLLAQNKGDARASLAPAFLLLCCYRFGMRSGEALGMLREDWVAYPYTVVVRVKNNKYRELKTPTSRRQIPLVFELSPEEKEIIDRWLAHVESIHGSNMEALLFFDDSKNIKLKSAMIKKTVIEALKLITGNPLITLHHARHAAANRVALAVCHIDLDSWKNLHGSSLDEERIPGLLLGDNLPSRRKSWAFARYLGHVRLRTTLRNYTHFLGEWADMNMDWGERGQAPNLRCITVLDRFPSLPVNDENMQGDLHQAVTPPTPNAILRLMRLAARGRPCKEAGAHLGFDEELVSKLDEMLRVTGGKASVRKIKGRLNEATDTAPYPFLCRVRESAWKRLIDFTFGLKNKPKQTEIPSLDHVALMIGARRQIVMWEEWQFALLQAMLEYIEIKGARYQMIHTDNVDPELIECAQKFGFAPKPRNEWIPTVNRNKKKEKPALVQIDGVEWGEGRRERIRVDMRCALIWSESDEGAIRSTFDLLAIFCAFAFSAWAKGKESGVALEKSSQGTPLP